MSTVSPTYGGENRKSLPSVTQQKASASPAAVPATSKTQNTPPGIKLPDIGPVNDLTSALNYLIQQHFSDTYNIPIQKCASILIHLSN